MDERSNKSFGSTSSANDNCSSSPVFSSELARAVCGYLNTVGCPQSRASLINEHNDLKEFNNLVQRGLIRTVDSNIEGMELLDIVNDYVMMKRELDNLVQCVFPGGDSGLLRSDGPLRKLKVLGSKFIENSSEGPLKRNNEGSYPLQSSAIKAAHKPSSDGLTKTSLNHSMPSIGNSSTIEHEFSSQNKKNVPTEQRINQQSRTLKLCEEIKLRERKRKIELAAAAEVKATEDEINRVLARSGIKRGKKCNPLRYRGETLNIENKQMINSANKTKQSPGTAMGISNIEVQPPLFHIQPLEEINAQSSHDESFKAGNLTFLQNHSGSTSHHSSPIKDDISKVSPSKSKVGRKSLHKMKTPKKKCKFDDPLALVTGEKVKQKLSVLTQESNEEQLIKIIGEPLANIIATNETHDGGSKHITKDEVVKSTTENFCSDAALEELEKILLAELEKIDNEKDSDHSLIGGKLDTTPEDLSQTCSMSTPIHQPEYDDPISMQVESESPDIASISKLDSRLESTNDSNCGSFEYQENKNERCHDVKDNSFGTCKRMSNIDNRGQKTATMNPENGKIESNNVEEEKAITNSESIEIVSKNLLDDSEKQQPNSQKLNLQCPDNEEAMISKTPLENKARIQNKTITDGKHNLDSPNQISFDDHKNDDEDKKIDTNQDIGRLLIRNESNRDPIPTLKKKKGNSTFRKKIEISESEKSPNVEGFASHEDNGIRKVSPKKVQPSLSFGEMISRTVKDRLSCQDLQDSKPHETTSVILKPVSVFKEDVDSEQSKNRETGCEQSETQQYKSKHNANIPENIECFQNSTKSKDLFVPPKSPYTYKEQLVGKQSQHIHKQNDAPNFLSRSVSSPAQRSYGYESDDGIYNDRPVSSPIAYCMESHEFQSKRLSTYRTRKFSDNTHLDGSTGPHGVMVKIGDFKKSILVNEKSLQAGVIAPSPQKDRKSEIVRSHKRRNEIESFNVMLDVVTSIPSDAVPIAVAKSKTKEASNDEKLSSKSNEHKNGGIRNDLEPQTEIYTNNVTFGESNDHKETKNISHSNKANKESLSLIPKNTEDSKCHGEKGKGRNSVKDRAPKNQKLGSQLSDCRNITAALKPVLKREINNHRIVNHLSNSNTSTVLQLMNHFATSQMTILQEHTKDTILEGLSNFTQFLQKDVDLMDNNISIERQHENKIQKTSRTKSSTLTNKVQASTFIDEPSADYDESANHSPAKGCTASPKASHESILEMPALELSCDTTSNSRYRHLEQNQNQSQFMIKTPIKVLDDSNKDNQLDLFTPQTNTISKSNTKLNTEFLESSMLDDVEMQLKTPSKNKITSPIKRKHRLPTVPSPTAYTKSCNRSPALKANFTTKVFRTFSMYHFCHNKLSYRYKY